MLLIPDAGWWVTGAGIIHAVIVFITAVSIGRNRRPTTAVAWLLAIALIPYIGLALFFLFGTTRLPHTRRRKQAQFDDILRDATLKLEDDDALTPVPDRFKPVSRLARELTAIPHLPGNRIRIHSNYNGTIEAMAAEIDTAETSVHVLFYAFADDDVTDVFFSAIERAVARGVTVRILYDQVGSFRYRGYQRMKKRLRESGAHWHRLYSIWPWESGWQRVDLRNHRKLVVVDGHVAWMGSQNMIERGYHRSANRDGERLLWKDLMVRVEGPMALGVDAVFRSDWFVETGELPEATDDERPFEELAATIEDASADGSVYDCQLVPSGPGYEHENNLRLFVQLLYEASERVVIASPYFAPDDSMLYAITTAAQRGVSIDLHVSEQGDQFFTQRAQQSYYEVLLRAGVRIWLYERPYVLHAKHMTVDDEVTLVGSSNMDMRSFTLNSELMLMVYGPEFADRMHEIELRYRAKSRELTLDEWLDRPRWQVAIDSFCRLTSVVQ